MRSKKIVKMLTVVTLLVLTITIIGTTIVSQFAFAIAGCGTTFKVNIIELPRQTAEASTTVTVQNIGPFDERGSSTVSIPGIGEGHLTLNFHVSSHRTYSIVIVNLPGQTPHEPSHGSTFPEHDACAPHHFPILALIEIPGIGFGHWDLTRVS
jgi:hypothetical protein